MQFSIKILKNIARNLRKNATEAEKILWQRLRNKQLEGFKFRRQQILGRYVVDFVNFERKLVIELDGGQHAVETERDKKRDNWLNEQGFEVIRFWNNELFENLEGVILPCPLPPGEGKCMKEEIIRILTSIVSNNICQGRHSRENGNPELARMPDQVRHDS